MRLVSYSSGGTPRRLGALIERPEDTPVVFDVGALAQWRLSNRATDDVPAMPTDVLALLRWRPDALAWVGDLVAYATNAPGEDLRRLGLAHLRSHVRIHAPIPQPPSVRDFYAFEQHVRQARARRGLAMVPEWYHFPVFYFSNPGSIIGPDEPVLVPRMANELDYELEIAAIIGRRCRDVAPDEADDVIAGYTILNDWSARDIQRVEMKVGLGPAKGKDFATSLGPCLVTLDELADRRLEPGRYDLEMAARVNGVTRSRGNWRDITWTFGQMISRASQDVWLQPGDVIGSGTVGTGCLLELGGDELGWLQPGDRVELEVERLGALRNVLATDKVLRAAS